MIRWSKELYLDEYVGKKPEKWKKRVEQAKPSVSLYCICFASNEKNLFDIINCNEFFFQYYKKREIFVIGLSKTREDAIDLLQDILEDIYRKTGNIKVREFFTFS